MKQCRRVPPELHGVQWPKYKRLDLCLRKEGHAGAHLSATREWVTGAQYSNPRTPLKERTRKLSQTEGWIRAIKERTR